MHPLWAVPPVALLIGVGVVLGVLRRVGARATEAGDELEKLAPLRSAVDALRTDSDRVRTAREALRRR